ncbi:hypothetical protein RJ640_008775 [Escallonia rubra]|uniref:Pentatricopeptide repeat-containing protein n=1 Tax=Escallonia rubra TaxID=112253 RepID=A0AA88UBV4_9ASTE|nr:hypothetical protein RJ640_008775 [Escallonia rubra]
MRKCQILELVNLLSSAQCSECDGLIVYQFAANLYSMRVAFLPKCDAKIIPNPTCLKLLQNFHHQTSSPSSSSQSLHPTHLNTLINNAIPNKNINHATQIHAQIITNNFASLPFLFSKLLNLYAKCSYIDQSLTLFATTHDESKNVVSWTSLITQLSHHNRPHQALDFFKRMMGTYVHPNEFTLSAVLPACAHAKIVSFGEQVHSLLCKHGFECYIFVATALVDVYAKCGDIKNAEKVFDEMPERNIVTWNAMIVGCLQNKLYDRAVGFFKGVIGERWMCPNEVSFSGGLSACANMGGGDTGRQVHGVAVKHGLISLAYVKNSLVDMYCKCGLFEDAVNLFLMIQDRDVVTWNVMAMGCVENDKFEEACKYFRAMRREGISPDGASFSTALHAAATIAALDQGTLIHDQIIKTGFGRNPGIASSLITMYAKCGGLIDARRAFDETEDRNVVSWTAMISAFQHHGCADQAVEFFEVMLEEGIEPNNVTLVCVLSAFSHSGRVDEGFAYFNSMTERHKVNPGPEHYACMVDLLGRAGRMSDAKRFVESMPIDPDASVLGALLGACRSQGDLELGREVAERLFEIEPNNPGNYVLLCNTYSRKGRLEEANEIRRLMGVKGVRKEPGCSWIDVKNKSFIFTASDRSHPRTNEIYEMLGELEQLVKTEEESICGSMGICTQRGGEVESAEVVVPQ